MKIELNHWFIKENEISISLIRLFVNINIIKNNNSISFLLTVIDEKKQE